MADEGLETGRREPFLKAPGSLLLLCASLAGAYAAEMWFGRDGAIAAFGFTQEDLTGASWWRIFTALFVHANLLHVVMNTGFVLALGGPPARIFGPSWRGGAVYLGFFLACGAIASLFHALIEQHGDWILVGASGAAAGLFGATARIIEGEGVVGPLLGRRFLGMAASWMAFNMIFLIPVVSDLLAGGPVSWQAHIGGFIAGALLVGVFQRFAGGGGARGY